MASKRLRALFSVISVIFMCVLLPGNIVVTGQELKNVRVGFFAFDGYHMESNGARSGYGYEMLQHLAGYTNWKYEYIGYYKSWNEMQDMLENGEIDILTSAQKTDERIARFDFSNDSIGTSAVILTVKSDNKKYLVGDYSAWNGMKIGLIDGSSRNDDLARFATEKGFTYETIYYRTVDELVSALKNTGEIDAAVTSNLRTITDEAVLAQFATAPFYIMVRKGDNELLAEINTAIAKLYNDEPGIRTKLYDSYYRPNNGSVIAFTAKELEYIKKTKDKPLTAIINPDRMPYSSFENGAPTGIVNDIIAEISLRSGLNFKIIEANTQSEYRNLAYSDLVDLKLDAEYNYNEAEENGYRLTLPYLDDNISCLHRKNNRNLKKIALLDGVDVSPLYRDRLRSGYSEIEYFDSPAQLIDAVVKGRYDCAYIYSGIADLAVSNDITSRLVADKMYKGDVSFSIAVKSELGGELFSVLNKTAASISDYDREIILNKYFVSNKNDFSLTGFLYDNPFLIALLVTVLFVIIILIMVSAMLAKNKKRESSRLTEEMRKNELLSVALSAAERADTAKSQFLSRVSHEMRTPLNAIIGFLALAKDADEKTTDVYLTNSEIAARQLLSVINDVLDMSAIESGKLKIASSPFDFKKLVQSVTNMYVAQCDQKGISFKSSLLTPADDWLIGDQLRVNQILLNILGNAVKFTDIGYVHLKISQFDGPGKKVFIRFEISDSGCGMTENMQSRLFKAFEQENASTAQRYGGSGLGLSIVKNLVTLMDGAISVKSRAGEGSTFTVDLPFGRCEVKSEVQLDSTSQSFRVLVVDDDRAEREYLKTVLENIGVRYSCADNGEAALEMIKNAQGENDAYNICLVDWKMPDVNGIEVTKRIRENYGSDVVVIVVSAYEHYQADEKALAAGADMFVSKPLFQSSLFDLFVNLSGGRLAKKASNPSVKYDFTGKRLLLAEDNVMNRMVAIGILEKFGIKCEVAEDGRVAYFKFKASEPGYYDAILMDIQMPNMNGYQSTRAIRCCAHPDAATIQIIALTANAFNDDITKTLSSGMNGHVTKPIDPDTLIKALDRAFSKKEG